MHRLAALLLPALLLALRPSVRVSHAAAPPPPQVKLTVAADGQQPAGWPLVVNVTLTNAGRDAISWWCGGPDVYPGAEHFVVQVRYWNEEEWHDVDATNGQNTQGSGGDQQLPPGKSIAVPLAVPVRPGAAGVSLRVRPREWRSVGAPAAEPLVELADDPRYLDPRRARVIEAVVTGNAPFWEHLADRYADGVVLDAMLKLVTIDNASIARRPAMALARQRTLPAAAGDALAEAVARWLPRQPRPEWEGLREYLADAALKTRAEAARAAVLHVMATTTDSKTRDLALNAVRLSPGDAAWLRRAKDAVLALRPAGAGDRELKAEQERAVEWLDAELSHPE